MATPPSLGSLVRRVSFASANNTTSPFIVKNGRDGLQREIVTVINVKPENSEVADEGSAITEHSEGAVKAFRGLGQIVGFHGMTQSNTNDFFVCGPTIQTKWNNHNGTSFHA
jgi:hypothetical protein